MPLDQNRLFDTRMLRSLVRAGQAGTFVAVGTTGGFHLQMLRKDGVLTLRTQRGDPRLFRKSDTLAKALQKLGVVFYSVDLSKWK